MCVHKHSTLKVNPCCRISFFACSQHDSAVMRQQSYVIWLCFCVVKCSWLKDMMRPVTSSIDGAESSSEDGLARPAPLPSREMVAGASYLACTLSAQVLNILNLQSWHL